MPNVRKKLQTPRMRKNGRWCESYCSQPEADEAKKCRMKVKMQETGQKYSETDKHRRTRFPLTKKRKSIIVLGRVLHRLEMHSSRQGRGKTMSFPVHPWKVVERGWQPNTQRFAESLMSLANGYMGLRGNFEEDYSGDSFQGTYLGGVWYPDKTRVGWLKKGYPHHQPHRHSCHHRPAPARPQPRDGLGI